jgi:phage gpG-like protein
MPGFSLEISVDNTDEVLGELDEAVNRALEAIGMQVENYAKLELHRPKPHASAPDGKMIVRPNVDTGRLVNSITHQVAPQEQAVYVGTNVEYAPYVELGTQKTRPYPYLKPAVMDHVSELKSLAEDALKGF